ncbi:DUF5677 domain-containing protein [Anaeromyxobacter sp. SG66]|uniref:DUF5677 domain-containing protein n=1 Tax=Anaeromyxobacter sp. SG66 TaxID=2925410 RepID=UPI001F583B0B|nr:DUF5677 domain-containing protein [Anaeromyxobacter sp. SG66]
MLPLFASVARHERWTERERQTLALLLTAAARSSESVLCLTAYGQVWDAEIVLRSVFEASLKFVYLLERPEAFKERHAEYSEYLFDLAMVKDHRKAEEFLAAIPNAGAGEWRAIRDRLLAKDELESILSRFPKKRRTELEHAWSFGGLISALTRADDSPYVGFAGLAWGYCSMSHLQHADYAGVVLPREREERAPQRRDALQLAHLARIIIDVVACLQIRLLSSYRFLGLDLAPVKETVHKSDALCASFGGAFERWSELEYGAAEG